MYCNILSAGIDDSSDSPLPVNGLSFTQHLNPFNSLSTYSNSNQWTLTAQLDFTNNNFNCTRTKSAHPATIKFSGVLTSNKNITTQLYGSVSTQSYSLISDTPNDYITSINCAQYNTGGAICVSIIEATFKSGIVKTVPGQGSLDSSNVFSSDNGFSQILVRSGFYIDNIQFTSATDNLTKSYGGNGGIAFSVEPTTTVNVLQNNDPDFNVIEPDLRDL